MYVCAAPPHVRYWVNNSEFQQEHSWPSWLWRMTQVLVVKTAWVRVPQSATFFVEKAYAPRTNSPVCCGASCEACFGIPCWGDPLFALVTCRTKLLASVGRHLTRRHGFSTAEQRCGLWTLISPSNCAALAYVSTFSLTCHLLPCLIIM